MSESALNIPAAPAQAALFGGIPTPRRDAIVAKLAHHLNLAFGITAAIRDHDKIAEFGLRGTSTEYFARVVAANFKIPLQATGERILASLTFGDLIDFISERTSVL